ncbi:MAG: AbrB/MazE/SpoVT family DNA-binding domain-containing protein [Clostridiales bacterium]|nr:AbrB/MazE/SpoVT family DNA-binding domain-containing protein [Clostridiales bacterium]
MKATGIVREIDNVGRLVLPKELRTSINLDHVEIFTEDDKIILKKYQPACIFCDNADDVIEYNGKKICRNCIEKLNSMIK